MEHLTEVLELAAAEQATWAEKSAEIRASGVPVNMADFIAFNEGKTEMAANGLPATCHFLLSTKGVDAGTAHTAGETLAAADLGEIPGTATGYGRKSQAEPAPVNGVVSFRADVVGYGCGNELAEQRPQHRAGNGTGCERQGDLCLEPSGRRCAARSLGREHDGERDSNPQRRLINTHDRNDDVGPCPYPVWADASLGTD